MKVEKEKKKYDNVQSEHLNIQIWDVQAHKKISNFEGSSGKVCCLAWNGNILCGGDSTGYISCGLITKIQLFRTIRVWDIRQKAGTGVVSLRGPQVYFISFYFVKFEI